jgi:hypothetical protein
MNPTMLQEPADIAIAVSALVNAVLGALIAFNVLLTQAQTGAIALVVNAAFGLGWSIYKTMRKTPPASAA